MASHRQTQKRQLKAIQHNGNSFEIVVHSSPGANQFIDLTSPDVIDLTTTASPVMRRNGPCKRGRRRRRNMNNETIDIDLDLWPPGSESSGQSSSGNPQSEERAEPCTVTCAICLDSIQEIACSSRKLVSTICGHVFCSHCMDMVMEKQQLCPCCRRRLNRHLIHPLHL